MKLKIQPKSQTGISNDTSQPTKSFIKSKKFKHFKSIIAIIAILLISVGVYFKFFAPSKSQDLATFQEITVSRQDIKTTLKATGTLAPLNQYNVTTLSRGEVLTSTFEEGDVVEKGDLLYTIDSSDVQDNIEKSRISLQQSQLSYNQQLESLADLSVTSTKSGVITEVSVKVGDNVQQGAVIAKARDSAVMLLKVPFNSSDALNFYVGQNASVTLDGSFETLNGSITAISASDTILTGNQIVRTVTISVNNPGAISQATAATAVINGIACNSAGNFEYNAEFSITADTSGKVSSLEVTEGSLVTNGKLVAKLVSTSLQNQVKNSELSLQNAKLSLQSVINSLDDYNITAPISGTIVTKNTQAGDSIDSSSGVSALAVIYDMSSLKFEIALDELDVNQVAIGQKVDVTVDALDGESFEGVITNISVAGTTANGATTYPVTVQIDNPPATLLPGMNVNASIITDESANTLAIPTAALQRGNVVFVKGNSMTNVDTSSKEDKNNILLVPDGYHSVQVETGLTNDSFIEITSGLTEGDIVYVPEVVRDTSNKNEFMMPTSGMAMPSGGMSGGMPSGGMSGGMPSGGRP